MSQVNSRKAFFEKLEQKKEINSFQNTSTYGAVPKKQFKPKSNNRVPPPPAQKRAPPPPRTNLNVAKSSQSAQAQQLWDTKTADFPVIPQKSQESYNGYMDNNFQAAEESPYGVNSNFQNKSTEQRLPVDWDCARKVWVAVQVFNTFYILSLGFAITTYSATKPKNHLFDGPHRTMFTMTCGFVMLQSFYNFALIFQQIPRTEVSWAWINGHGFMVTLIVIMMTIHNCTFLKHEGPAYNVAVGCTNILAQIAMMYVMSGYSKCGKNSGYEHYYD